MKQRWNTCILVWLGIACAGSSPATAQSQAIPFRATGVSRPLSFQGREREYRIHVPARMGRKERVPLVVMLHGGGGDAKQASRYGMSQVADQHGFIVVYPNAIDKHWNDGRVSPLFREHDAAIDDVAFLTAAVRRVSKDHRIDPGMVFVAGASNGGFMAQRMAMEKPETFAAAAIVIASMAEPLSKDFHPRQPVSIMFMNGTQDPLVPYEGGTVGKRPVDSRRAGAARPGRGQCISTDDAVRLWLERNKLQPSKAATKVLPDEDAEDGSQVERTRWLGGEAGTAVVLYRVVGGGQSIPGGRAYLPQQVIGTVNRDIDGMATIWNFFQDYARK